MNARPRASSRGCAAKAEGEVDKPVIPPGGYVLSWYN